jgi:Cell wall-associated hydrolases (invasion-associated proteins)
MMEPADCQQRPGAHYPRNAVLALCIGLLAACGGSGNVRPDQRQPPPRAWADQRPVDPTKANAVLMRAISLVGTPYRYGGNTPEGGFDCSGLINYVFRDMLDLRLPRTSRELAATKGGRIAPDRLAGGDLVFFGSDDQVSHVGIYVGEGRFVHAPNSGGTVRLDSLDGAWWRDHYTGARRLLN